MSTTAETLVAPETLVAVLEGCGLMVMLDFLQVGKETAMDHMVHVESSFLPRASCTILQMLLQPLLVGKEGCNHSCICHTSSNLSSGNKHICLQQGRAPLALEILEESWVVLFSLAIQEDLETIHTSS